MGRRGPPKKPTKLKEAQKQRKRDMPKGEIFPQLARDARPKFELSARGNEIFVEVSKILGPLKLHTEADTYLLVRYCDIFDQWLRYRDELIKGPAIAEYVTQNGFSQKPNPALKPYLELHREMLSIEKQFGMTPAARASIIFQDKGKKGKGSLQEELYGDD